MAKRQFKKGNYAFIDAQNLNLGIKELGWRLDLLRFRIYLTEKYQVKKAYMFLGYLPNNQNLYKRLQEYDYVLIFKPILRTPDGKIKGNVDADLVLQVMIDYKNYEQAVVITSDGDFYCVVNYLYEEDKLKTVLSPIKEKCSVLLQKAAREKINFLNTLQFKLEYKKKKHR